MRHIGLTLAVAFLGVTACSSSQGITDPRRIEMELVGNWLESPPPTQHGSTRIMLAVDGTTVTGTGQWSGEDIQGGNIVVTGEITGSEIQLQLAEDNGTTLRFIGHMVNDNEISGEFVGSGAPVAVSYSRGDPPPIG